MKIVKQLTSYVLFVSFILLGTVHVAFGDSWLLPEETSYSTADKTFTFRVIPPSFEERNKYYEEHYKDKENRASIEELRERFPCIGRLERQVENQKETLWERPLLNDVAPTKALVTSNGHYVVTFDEWHSVGYGPNVVVIYGQGGRVVRRIALNDFLSNEHIAGLPHTVSSIWWGIGPSFDDKEEKLVLRVIEPGTKMSEHSPRTSEIHVVLANGEIDKKTPKRSSESN
jgi:hypothetical protein